MNKNYEDDTPTLQIIFVYLGNRLPKYARRNLAYIKNSWPNESITLVSDLDANLITARKLGLKTFRYESQKDLWEKAKGELQHPMNFRKGFWFHTIARFDAIADYSKIHPKSPILYIETDVWISSTFPIAEFRKSERPFAFCLHGPGLGSAAILQISDSEAATLLASYSLDQIKKNPHTNDMVILNNLRIDFPDKVQILPSIFNDGTSTDPVEIEFFKSASVNRGLEGFFDPLYWGKFLTGVDPRNHRGQMRLYHQDLNSPVRCNSYLYRSPDGESVYVSHNSVERALYCLHIHSKDVRYFSIKKSRSLLKLRVRRAGSGPVQYRDWRITMVMAGKAFKRRLS